MRGCLLPERKSSRHRTYLLSSCDFPARVASFPKIRKTYVDKDKRGGLGLPKSLATYRKSSGTSSLSLVPADDALATQSGEVAGCDQLPGTPR